MRALIPWLLFLLLLGCSDRTTVRGLDMCTQEYEPPDEDGNCDAPASAYDIEWRDGRGPMCSVECEDELDCPSVGASRPRCLEIGRTRAFLCYTECRSDADCHRGWVCQPLSSGGRVCLP